MSKPTDWFRGPKTPWTWPLIVLGALIGIVFIGVVLALTFAGCAKQPGYQETYEGGGSIRQGSSGDFTEHSITLSDGRTVTCLTWSSHNLMDETTSSGVDCLEPGTE